MKRLIPLLLCALCLLGCAAAPRAEEDPVAFRALLVACDSFLTHESTAPIAAMNVERMERLLRTDAREYAVIAREDNGLGGIAQLENALDAAFAGADENDTSLIYLCTHGLYDRVAYQPMLVLSDGKTEENLTAEALRQLLDRIPGQKILLLDACNSGAFIGKGVRGSGVKNVFAGPDYKVLTSAGGTENSFLWRDRQLAGGSYFAQELCEGLRSAAFDLNADGAVTLREAAQGLLECHGASTVQAYPQEDAETVLYLYDPQNAALGERPLGEIVLEQDVLSDLSDTLYFSFTVNRPVRVQYQIIYYRSGQWRFDAPQVVQDSENADGALSPGRKQRAITLVSEEDAPFGYVLLQIVAQEGRYAMLAGSRLIAVQPETGDPSLRVQTGAVFAPAAGEEMPVYVYHRFPCSLTVRILDSDGNLVRRLSYKTPSRPTGERLYGSYFYWDGRTGAGELALSGEYTAEVTCVLDGESWRQSSVFTLNDAQ